MLDFNVDRVKVSALVRRSVILYANPRMSLTREDVTNIANLARLGLSEEELEQAGKDLNSILKYIDRLQKIDTTGVPEAASPVVEASGFRPDEVDACTDAERALIMDNFPASERGMLKAPAVFEKPKA